MACRWRRRRRARRRTGRVHTLVQVQTEGFVTLYGVQVEEAQARAEEDRQRREGQQCASHDCLPHFLLQGVSSRHAWHASHVLLTRAPLRGEESSITQCSCAAMRAVRTKSMHACGCRFEAAQTLQKKRAMVWPCCPATFCCAHSGSRFMHAWRYHHAAI